MTRSSHWLLLCGVAFAAAVYLGAQSDEWFQSPEHSFKNRWEGLFGENQGSPEWEVRSFVGNVESYPMNKNVDLKVTYYVPDSSLAFIRATAINRTPSYLMVPKQNAITQNAGWRSFEGWSTQDVLMPHKIASTNLGVLIRLGADSEAVHLLAPAIVYSSNKPGPLTDYRFSFYTAEGIARYSFTVAGQKSYSRTYSMPGSGPRSLLPIVFNAPEIPDGPTRVSLNLEYENSSKRTLEWKFYSKGLP